MSKEPKSPKNPRVPKLSKKKQQEEEEEIERAKKAFFNLPDSDDEEEDENLDEESDNENINSKSKGAKYDDYFATRAERTKTSNRTLSELKILDKKQIEVGYSKYLERDEQNLSKLRENLYQQYKSEFPFWMFQLQYGFNLLYYGFGSKKKLLEKLARKYFANYPTVVVYGFVPHVTIKNVLSTITQSQFGAGISFRNPVEHCEYIERVFASPSKYQYLNVPEHLFLLIHNIDGPSFRNSQAQRILSSLAIIPQIRIIASVDHINSPILWDNSMSSRFNWLWHNVPTYEPYILELRYEQPVMLGGGKNEVAPNGIRYVLQSLTSNARGVFVLIANHQLENPKEGAISYKMLYEKCREKYLVPTEAALRAHLREFGDHKVIKSKKAKDGIYFCVNCPPSVLKNIVEELDENKQTED